MSILQAENLSKQYSLTSGFAVKNASFEAYKGELLALVGESGSGKTTLLRLIAGFEEPDEGRLLINEKVMATSRKSVVPEKRKVGMVFQDYALFPHLTVFENIAFGLHHLPQKARKARVEEVIELVNLQGFGKRYPYELSGGQQQRTALARALAPNPSLVLLDEPFSNLDDIMKDQVREDVRKIIKQTGTTAVFVTHDTRDALSTADRIAVLKEGCIQQIGTPEAIYTKPSSVYVASFFGKINVMKGTLVEGGYQTPAGFIPGDTKDITKNCVTLVIRPEDLFLSKQANAHLSGIVEQVFYFGSYQQVVVRFHEQVLQLKTGNEAHILKGQELHFQVDSGKIRVLESE